MYKNGLLNDNLILYAKNTTAEMKDGNIIKLSEHISTDLITQNQRKLHKISCLN